MQDQERAITFGQVIARARKSAHLNLRDMARQIKKEDGKPISHQYLSDLEHDRRNPPSDHLIEELARALKVSPNYLYFHARRLPADFNYEPDEDQADAAYQAMRKQLEATIAA